MHSFIVTNWDLDPRQLPFLADFPSLHHPDVLLIEPGPSITITQIRDLKLWLARQPYQSQTKAAVILQAHTLTLPAQHALLKSLEEPPPDTIIILATNQPDSLIPTIHSRCQLIQLTGIIPVSQSSNLPQLTGLTPGQRLALAQTYTTKDQAINLCTDLIHTLRNQLKTQPSRQLAGQLRLTQTSLTHLNHNLNPKLVLENLFLHL